MIKTSNVDDGGETLSSAVIFDKLKWMTSQEAALYLRVSVGHIRNMVCKGKLRAYRLKSRLRFLRSELDNLMKPAF